MLLSVFFLYFEVTTRSESSQLLNLREITQSKHFILQLSTSVSPLQLLVVDCRDLIEEVVVRLVEFKMNVAGQPLLCGFM